MKITIVAWGGNGDVRPYVALALGLQQAGHVVQFATHATYQEFVTSFGINCFPMEWNSLERPLFISQQPFISIGLNSDQVQSLEDGLLPELWRVCQQTEAIIFNGPSYPCSHIAEKLGIPCFATATQPHHQTGVFPHPFVTNGKSLGSIYNWLSYPFFDQVFWQAVRQPINHWRQKILGLQPLPVWEGVVRRMQKQKIPFLYSYSPSFLPKRSEWTDDSIHVTGYWYLDTSENWQPPTDLMNFLSAGSPPVYMSNIWHDEKFGREVILKLLDLTGQRLIVQGLDDKDFSQTDLTDRLFYIKGMIPHEWLFPQMAAVVHHGGTGTTMSSLRAGVPMIITPFKGEHDHFFWALRLLHSGLGIVLTSHGDKVSVEKLAFAIQTAINDKAMQLRVVEMSKRVQAENGVMRAVEAFHRHLLSKFNHNIANQHIS